MWVYSNSTTQKFVTDELGLVSVKYSLVIVQLLLAFFRTSKKISVK